MRLDGDIVQTAAVKDAAVRLPVLLVRDIEPRGMEIEGIRVLHDELPHPKKSAFRTGLVAELGLNLIPDLRQLLVAAQLVRDRSHDFLVSHGQAEVAASAVAQPEQIIAHGGPASGLLP